MSSENSYIARIVENVRYAMEKLCIIPWMVDIIIIIIIIIPRPIFIVMYRNHDHKVIVRVHSVHVMNVEQRQAAADPQTKPVSPPVGCYRIQSPSPFTVITQPES